jgi:transcriptional regulator with XRE-family HTH domain
MNQKLSQIPPPLTKFGDRVRRLRLDLRLTQGDLSETCGLSSNSVVSRIEQNAYMPTIGIATKIAERLNCTVGYLIGESDLKNAPSFDAYWRDFYKDFTQLKESDMLLLSNIAKLMLKDYDRRSRISS